VTPSLFRFTRTGDTSQELTVYYTVSGTATPGADYQALPGEITFAANSATADVTIIPLGDTTDEPLEWVTVAIADGAGYEAVGAASVVIADDDPTAVTVEKITDAAESGGKGVFRFYRTNGDPSDPLIVSYTVGGTAAPGWDYTTLSGTVAFEAGAITADVVVNPVADAVTDPDETVSVQVQAGSGYVIGTQQHYADLTIKEEAAGAIRGRLWLDVNGNGWQDSGEGGYADASVFLLYNDELVDEQTTDANGEYEFTGVTAGTYKVLFGVPGGFIRTNGDSLPGGNGHEFVVAVAAGATTTEVSEGVQAPSNPTPTGTRDGIRWDTLDRTRPRVPIATPPAGGLTPLSGLEYPVQTVGGHTIWVFEADHAATQPPVIRNTPGLDIRYNCHGLSLNTTNVILADGSVHDFHIINPAGAPAVLLGEYELKSPSEARVALASGKRVVFVWYNSDQLPIHSALATSITVDADGKLNRRLSTCDSKNGTVIPETRGATVQSIHDIYTSPRVEPPSARAVNDIQIWVKK
jgi:hypothetical protein